MRARLFALSCTAILLSACSTITTIDSPTAGTTFELENKTLALPASTKVGRTTFGHFAFRATESAKPDAPPFYGILPLALRKGQLVAGIVLTAPVMLLTKLRGAFKFYEVDARTRTIRYRNDANDPWVEYRVKPEESENAREWFDERDAEAKEEAAEKAAEAKQEAEEQAADAREDAAEQAAEQKKKDETSGSP